MRIFLYDTIRNKDRRRLSSSACCTESCRLRKISFLAKLEVLQVIEDDQPARDTHQPSCKGNGYNLA